MPGCPYTSILKKQVEARLQLFDNCKLKYDTYCGFYMSEYITFSYVIILEGLTYDRHRFCLKIVIKLRFKARLSTGSSMVHIEELEGCSAPAGS